MRFFLCPTAKGDFGLKKQGRVGLFLAFSSGHERGFALTAGRCSPANSSAVS
jgi:hypothetical protein